MNKGNYEENFMEKDQFPDRDLTNDAKNILSLYKVRKIKAIAFWRTISL